MDRQPIAPDPPARPVTPPGRVFTYREALDSFPTIERITELAVRQIEALVSRIRSREELDGRRAELEEAYRQIVEAWTMEINRLGCDAKGLWLVDWDSGDGYYCWRYGEATIGHFHGYDEGFAGRIAIT